MGLIKNALNSATGVLSEQYKEYFYCESIPADVLVLKGKKRNTRFNNNGSDNVISDGSILNVADGQCALIVESGKVVELCSEPGEYTYDTSTEPSLFYGSLSENIVSVFSQIGKRFTFGGEVAKDQRIYYFNTKEIMGNKYGTPNPVPFRVVDQRAGIDIDISLRCFGEYSYRIVNPILFYQNVCGNISDQFVRQNIESQLRTELLTKLQPAFASMSAMGIRYSAIGAHTVELADVLRKQLSDSWTDRLGIEIQAIGVSSLRASEEDEQMLKDMQRTAAYTDPKLAMAYMVGSQGQAMKDAANNAAGASVGFMGMNLAAGMGGNTMSTLQQMIPPQPANPTPMNPEPQRKDSWTCKCGTVNTSKFCLECGSPKPVNEGWTCQCGAVNKGKFCPECGAKKPAGVPQYKCDKCGWEPAKNAPAPRFCPECGDPFDNDDIV